ncbi:hypothetical protein [Methanosarcina vacuolata]|uniref:hypothetical protein n=1 Tax=Methanosarcina vacuolata TaxID=2215 RepID=UPI000AF0532D|nr:hypothetical protein [Methanosarcina vacuolata]
MDVFTVVGFLIIILWCIEESSKKLSKAAKHLANAMAEIKNARLQEIGVPPILPI